MSELFNQEPPSVKYHFDEDILFGGVDWQGHDEHYDIEQSKDNFAALCGNALAEAFPNSIVEIDNGIISVTATDFDDPFDAMELEIEYIFNSIYESYEWVVTERVFSIINASTEFGLPIHFLQWAIAEGYIECISYNKIEIIFSETQLQTFLQRVSRYDEGIYVIGVNYERVEFSIMQKGKAPDLLEILNSIHIFIVTPDYKNLSPLLLPSSDHFLVISGEDGHVDLCFQYLQSASYDSLNWSRGAYFGEFIDQAASNLNVASRYFDGNVLRVDFRFSSNECTDFESLINKFVYSLNELVIETENKLVGGFHWREEYEYDEDLFCRRVLEPLLKHMGFLHVKYTHGTQEFGKDFTFSEKTPFDTYRYYGLQAKAGDLSGNATSKIHEIVNQANLAFDSPYSELDDLHNSRYISTFIIAISGTFRGNAPQVILNTVRVHNRGSIHFIDQSIILNLIDKYWPRN